MAAAPACSCSDLPFSGRLCRVEAWIRGLLSLFFLFADVTKFCDTVGVILDAPLGRLGLPAWFRKVHLAHHAEVRSSSNGLLAWERLQPKINVFFSVALSACFSNVRLHVSWCR